MGKTAFGATALLAVGVVELYEGLRVGGAVYAQAFLCPAAYNAVVLGAYPVQEIFGFIAEFGTLAVLAISLEHWYYGVYYEYIELLVAQISCSACEGAAELCVVLPVTAWLRLERVAQLFYAFALGNTGCVGSFVVE